MANRAKAVPENIAGDFFVDNTCIDCGTCRHVAPETFDESDDYSYVWQQPRNKAEREAALKALMACPVGSIGAENNQGIADIRKAFPALVAENVYYCGFTSPKSYGASSYFIEHPDGNWLIDSPKFLPHLVEQFEKKGGIRHIFLSHSDDVAEAARYAEYFNADRIIHEKEAWSQPGSERILEGEAAVVLTPEFTVIPTPGHTKGHCVLLYKNRFLFSGDHLWWQIRQKQLGAPENILWNRTRLVESLEKLLNYSFEWLLPGHGAPIHLNEGEMHAALRDLTHRLRQAR